jgi:hypothetical protein
MKKHIFTAVVLLIGCQYLLAQEPDSIPITAKSAWGIVSKHLETKYGSSSLYMLQAGDILKPDEAEVYNTDDTLLFIKGKDQWGDDSLYWKGTAYRWNLICGYKGLSQDSILSIFVTEHSGKPTTITETINAGSEINLYGRVFKPIQDEEWFNSDSLYLKIPDIYKSYISQRAPLTMTLLQSDDTRKSPDTVVVWAEVFYSTFMYAWSYFDAKTADYLGGVIIGDVDESKEGDKGRVYPNPSASTFSLDKEYSYQSVQIANTMGEVMATWLNTETGKVFSTDGIPSGVYILRTNRGGKQYSQPLVISR